MTPILNAAPGSRKEVYATRHVQARNSIERCFGLLKARWRCLLKHRILHYHAHVASEIIHACCVLHNIALHARLPPPTDVAEQHGHGNDIQALPTDSSSQDDLMRGRAMLNGLENRILLFNNYYCLYKIQDCY
ncbi:hypothetical protein ABMA28_003320 [Loxostege sticticalis]|uniref:DDE Tnp4 domain-containing protein n=1 Tax=Loxostege sticticalis TaxID=481309 RepID=A0ABD0SVQ3_LOXSC